MEEQRPRGSVPSSGPTRTVSSWDNAQGAPWPPPERRNGFVQFTKNFFYVMHFIGTVLAVLIFGGIAIWIAAHLS